MPKARTREELVDQIEEARGEVAVAIVDMLGKYDRIAIRAALRECIESEDQWMTEDEIDRKVMDRQMGRTLKWMGVEAEDLASVEG